MGACNIHGCNGACIATGICPDEMRDPMPHGPASCARNSDPASKGFAFAWPDSGAGRTRSFEDRTMYGGTCASPDEQRLNDMVEEAREARRQDAYNELFRKINDKTATASMIDMHKLVGRMEQIAPETPGQRLARNFGPFPDPEEGPVADILASQVRDAIACHEDTPTFESFEEVLTAYEELFNYYREQLDAAETQLERQEGIDQGGYDYTAEVWAQPSLYRSSMYDEVMGLAREIFAKRVGLDATRWGYSMADAVNEAREAIAAASD